MSNIEVVGLGAMNLDRLYRVERILTDGEAPVKEAQLSAGGSAANTIYALAKLGIKTGFMGAVGDDWEGKALVSHLQSVGAETAQVKVKKVRTGSVLCLTDELGQRAMYVLSGANETLSLEDVSLDYVNQSEILHLSSFLGRKQLDLQRDLLKRLSPSVKVSFAPGSLYVSEGFELLTPLLRRANFLFVNGNEISRLTGGDFRAGARKCLEQGCGTVVVTLGKGVNLGHSRLTCYITNGKEEHLVEAKDAEEKPAKDTTGAGDAFAAGFLYGFLKGKSPRECGLLGDILARFSIAEMGAREGLPTLDALAQVYQERYGNPL